MLKRILDKVAPRCKCGGRHWTFRPHCPNRAGYHFSWKKEVTSE